MYMHTAFQRKRKHTGKYHLFNYWILQRDGRCSKEFGVPEGGCEGVSGFLFCVSLLFIVIIRSKTYAPDSPLVQLTFSKDGGSDGVNTEVRWSYCDLCISTLWKSNLLIYAVNLYSCYSALKGLAIHMLYFGEEVS